MINNAQIDRTLVWMILLYWKCMHYYRALKDAAHVFVTYLLYIILNIEISSTGCLGIKYQLSYIKIKTLWQNSITPYKFILLYVKLVRKLTIVQFHTRHLLFVKKNMGQHKCWPKARKAENINRWTKSETCCRPPWRPLSNL